MVPTDAGLRMIAPSAHILRDAEMLFSSARSFDAATSTERFRLTASDYLDPLFLPMLVSQIKMQAPHTRIDLRSLSNEANYLTELSEGRTDIVIGNWASPPDELHMGRLFDDEVVCLVSKDHPANRRGWTLDDWLGAEHIAPTPTHPGAKGFIDEHLASLGLGRQVVVRCPYFGLIPAMVASSLLVLTTGRQYCERFTAQLPVNILPCPLSFPRMMYYQLWHERTHASASGRWLRERIKGVAQSLGPDTQTAP